MTLGAKIWATVETDAFRNLTSFVAALMSVAALVVSIVSLNHASDAQQAQKEMNQRQEDDIEVYPGMVLLTADNWDHEQDFSRKDDAHDPPVIIPVDTWKSSSIRSVMVRVVNRGLQTGFLDGVCLVTDSAGDGSVYCDASQMNPQCSVGITDHADWKACPEAFPANDGYSLTMNIPEAFVSQLKEDTRKKGLTVCVHARSAKNRCADIGVVIPDGAGIPS